MKLPVRIISLVATLAGFTGAWFAQGVNFPIGSEVALEPIAVTTEAKPVQLYCPGPLVELGGKAGTDLGSLALIGKANVSYRLGAGSLLEDPAARIETGTLLAMASGEQGSKALTANQNQLIQRPRMAGLAATNCAQPQAEGWLLNGMAGSGFESILVIGNPNPVEVQVEFTIHLASTTNSQLVTLAPFAEKQISLASLVEAEPEFAIHFQSSGQKVSVALQNRSSSGLSATGVELKGPTLTPAKNLVFPGFEILAAGLAEPALRIFNPGSVSANALVSFLGSGTNSDVVQVEVPAGGFEIVYPKLLAGDYLVLVDSDTEVMAELYNPYLATNFDFAWISPVPNLTGEIAMAIPSLRSKLAIANAFDQPVDILLTLDSGTQALSIPARSQLLVDVTGNSLVLKSDGNFSANLILTDPKGYAVLSARENANLGSNIQVLVR